MADLLRVSTRQRAARLTVETLNCDYVWFLGRDPVSVGYQWIHLHQLWTNTRASIASSYSLCVILWSTAELLQWCPCFATSYYGMLGKFNLRQITKNMQKKRKLQTRWQCMCSILEHLTLIHIYIHQHETLEHYLKMCLSLSADLSLDHFAMRRFYNDTLSALMTPSQKR